MTPVMAMYGQEEDGESKLCAPLFQIQEEEEDKTEEKENEDPEDRYKEKKERNKSDCTTLRDDLSVGSIMYLSFWHVTTIYCTASRPNKEFCLLIQHAHILIHLRSASINGTYPGLPA